MQSHLKHYVKAVTDLIQEGGDLTDVLKQVKGVMDKKGHQKLYPLLLNSLKRELSAPNYAAATLIIAKPEDEQKYQPGEAKVVIDPSIVGGFVHTEDFVRIDESYKHKLLTLYKKTIAKN